MAGGDRTLNVFGESSRNADGGQRQIEIKRCQVGEPIELRPEPGNRHGMSAVGVFSCRGIKIGNFKAEQAREISGRLAQGAALRAIVERINGGTPDRPSLGIAIQLNLDGIPSTTPRPPWLDRLFGSGSSG